jgi:hypothetical protein
MFKKLFFVLLVFSFSILAFALDDQGNPNDPNVNERANACYEDGSMAGKCDSDWEWEGGWYLIRFQSGLISRADFPAQYAILLPPLLMETGEQTLVLGPPIAEAGGCQFITPAGYVDFGTGNLLYPGSPKYDDASCTIYSGSDIGAILLYTTAGQAVADIFCQGINSMYTATLWNANVYVCFF